MTTIILQRDNLTATQDGDHVIFEGGKYGMHSIYVPEHDEKRMDRIEAHWMGYCENNGQDYDAIEEAVDEDTGLKAGDNFDLYVNQGQREGQVIAVIGDEALVEYEMPAGTTGMQIVPTDESRNWGKTVNYKRCPNKWIEAIREQTGGWEGNSQVGGYVDFPAN